jgi:hypothetical protein
MDAERAVRALAGAFVLTSVALGWWVHAGFFLFTAFVGANLLQSGFTDTCPALWLLRKRAPKSQASCCASPTTPAAR